MIRFLLFFLVGLIITATKEPADIIFRNAVIHTVNPRQPAAEALAVRGNRIVYVGDDNGTEEFRGSDTKIIDAGGRFMMPGFNDAHLHFVGGGESLLRVNLVGAASMQEIAARLKEATEQTPDGEWIVGRGWDHTLFNNGDWPTRQQLDAAAPNHPVYLKRVDGHVAWVNTAALKLAGIHADTKAPDGGDIVRDADGIAIGILKETAANLVGDIIPETTPAQKRAAIRAAIQHASKLGITSVQDNSGIETLEIYHELQQSGNLTLRISEWVDIELDRRFDELKADIKKYAEFCDGEMLRLGQLKGFVDGTLGSRTAYFFKDYADKPGEHGLPQYTESELDQIFQLATRLNRQVGLHCIGDKANWMVLRAIERSQMQHPQTNLRHRLEHAQILRPRDIPKFAELNVIASMQSTHCTTDLRWAEKRLGDERCASGAYAWKTIRDSGAHLCFGTDWPVEPLDPMRGLYSAVTRRNIESGEPKHGWTRHECLTIEQAIEHYTLESAYAEFMEDEKGSLEVGKLADLILLDTNLLTCPPQQILNTGVVFTMLDGKIVLDNLTR